MGVSIGAGVGGKLIQGGRRKSLVMFILVGMVGTGLIMIENVWVLLLGRIIQGVARGVTAVAANRLIEETVPLAIFGSCMAINNLFQMLGTLLAYSGALILPSDEDLTGLEEDKSWRLMYGFPFLIYTIVLACMCLFLRLDTPKFYVMTDDIPSARKAIRMIYKMGPLDNSVEQMIDDIQVRCST